MKKIIGILIVFALLIIGISINYFDQKDLITESMVKDLILKDLNVEENDLYFSHIDLVKEKNKYIYKIEFNDNLYTYNYQINAKNKKIIYRDKKEITDEVFYLSKEDILNIVLKHANLKEEDCNIISNNLILDSIPYYKTIFYYANYRYEYTINAYIGEIISVVKINEKNTP